jgi:hypothetical protein
MKEMGDAFPENNKKGIGSANRMMRRDYEETMKRTGIEKYQFDKGGHCIWIQNWHKNTGH